MRNASDFSKRMGELNGPFYNTEWEIVPLSQYGNILTKSPKSGGNFSVRALLRTENDEIPLVLNRGKKPKFQLPGGRVEWGENPHNAILREIREELEDRITHIHVYKIPFLITRIPSKFNKYEKKINIWYMGRCSIIKPKSFINDSWETPENEEIMEVRLIRPTKKDGAWEINAFMNFSHLEALKTGLDSREAELGQLDEEKDFNKKIYEMKN